MGKYLISLSILISTSVSFAHDACFHVTKKMELADLVEHTACKDLEVGEKKTVNFNESSSPSGIEHKYVLEKTAPNTYKAKINLEFHDTKFISGKPSKLGRRMQARINECLKENNPKLIGPNGEKLTIELVPPAEKHLPEYADIKTSITVDTKPVRRAHSHYYGIKSSCSTVMHELFHLMGLTDEYQEVEYILPFEQDCRSYGPEDSIMSDSSSTSRDGPSGYIMSCMCTKPEGCQTYPQSQFEGQSTCPPDYKLHVMYGSGSPESLKSMFAITRLGTGMMMAAKPIQQILLGVRPSAKTPNSLLYPAHFRAIIFPGCKAKNSIYYKCADESYIRPLKYIQSCSNKPKVCSDPTEWLK